MLTAFLSARKKRISEVDADAGVQIAPCTRSHQICHRISILAFGFGNLAMLGWLAAAAAPLLIHLWSRHRFREAPWAAMQFLLAAMRKNARRLQLQQWLLLAVRTLIIVLVVLAVAEPYGERLLAGGSAAPTPQNARDRRFVLDGLSGEPKSLTSPSQAARRELVRDSRAGDVFTVIRMAAPGRVLVGPRRHRPLRRRRTN